MENNNQIRFIDFEGKIKSEDYFTLQLKLFNFIGCDLIKKKSSTQKYKIFSILKTIQFLACATNVILFMITLFTRTIMDIQNIAIIVKVLPNAINIPYNFFSKYVLINIRRQKVLKLFKNLKQFFPTTKFDQKKYKIETQINQFIKALYYYSICYFLLVSSTTVYSAYLLFFHKIRKPLIEIWFPFDDLENNLIFIITSLWIALSGGICCLVLIACDWTIFAFVNILAIAFDMFGEELKFAINQEDEKSVRNLIKKHKKLIAIFDEISEIFSLTFLCSFFVGAASVSVSGFQLATSNDLGEITYSIPYTLGSLSQIFLYCYFGQRIIDSTYGVSKNINESNWILLKNFKLKKMISMISQRSQKLNSLIAYGFVVLNLETFSMIMSSAFSYFTLLKNLYFKN
ncbi:hypothetical protein PVAND_006028 [Polypedilum vanderplanki]|uniref:Odorant receptor n=1 Tax=Polypedilum vanderplanki TaxID=319348 RepID=A0A9J6C2Y7_POLVA|nr:hypothetical protein PVAND_006028 [Polypedilum vanderplanki]